MTESRGSDFTRRSLLAALGAGGAAIAVGGVTLDGAPAVAASPATAGRVAPEARIETAPPKDPAPPGSGLHVGFGGDASSEVSVAWHSVAPVTGPRVLIAREGAAFERSVDAVVASYVDGKSGTTVYAYHARLGKLRPGTSYQYVATHDGAKPEFGTFSTAPKGRVPFRFTSFGDQGTPTVGKFNGTTYVNDNLGSPAAGDTTMGVESV